MLAGACLATRAWWRRGEFGGVFVGEADGVGGALGRHGEAVARGGVGGGASFAFGRNRPMGFFPVGAGGGAAAFG